MENLLSQEEVDALLQGINEGDIPTETAKEESISGIEDYDFTSQNRIIRGRLPTLEVIHHRFCYTYRTTLSTILRRIVDVSAASIEMIKFGDFLKAVPVPASFHIFRLKPLRGMAVMVFESKIIFSLIDCYFGGEGRFKTKVEGRDFTEIEQKIIEKVTKEALKDLEVAWKPIYPLTIQWERSEINPQFISIVPPNEAVIVASFEIEIDEHRGLMTLCVPYSTIEPIRRELQTGFQTDGLEVDQVWVDRIKGVLKEVDINVSVDLGQLQLCLRDLVNLRPGDILQLDKDADEELIVKIDGVPKFRGCPGILKGNKAIQISSVIYKEMGGTNG
jgi:flagellar motor switch protein FliM